MTSSVGHCASRVYGIPQRLGRMIVTSVETRRGVMTRRETLASGTGVSGLQAKAVKHWHQAAVFQPVGARSSAARIAATCAGVEPQHAPITPTPSSRICTAYSAITSGVPS